MECDGKSKIRSNGQGRGLGIGKGKGPLYRKKRLRNVKSNKRAIS